jgi:atypical dual specificity phosphatase
MRTFIARLLFWPTLGWNLLLARVIPSKRRWWDRVDRNVILGALPFASSVQPLYDAGVRAVVNTCQEYAGPIEEYERLGIEQLRIPTTDFTPPRLADVRRAVAFIAAKAEKGETVYVHCKAGRARSATVVACWLMYRYRISAAEAVSRLRQVRPHIVGELEERPVVREFEKEA